MSMDFGKLNFAVGFNRTSAFPLDANSYFESYTDAVAAAAYAAVVGSSDSAYYIGQLIIVNELGKFGLYQISANNTLVKFGQASSEADLQSQLDALAATVEGLNTSKADWFGGTAPVNKNGEIVTIGDAGSITASGIKIVNSAVNNSTTEVPTSKAVQTYVASQVAGAVQYLGTVSALTGLSTTAGKGDFYRLSAAIEGAHAGDLVVAEKDNPQQLIDGTNWSLIHGEEVGVESINAGSGINVSGSEAQPTIAVKPATTTSIGGIIVGTNLTVDETGKLSAIDTTYTLPEASEGALGGIRVGYSGTTAKTYAVKLDANNKAYVEVPWQNTTYTNGNGLTLTGTSFSLNVASSAMHGGIKLYDDKLNKEITPQTATDTNGRYYRIQLDSANRAFVNVPWTDTTYHLPIAKDNVLGGIKSGVDNNSFIEATQGTKNYQAEVVVNSATGIAHISLENLIHNGSLQWVSEAGYTGIDVKEISTDKFVQGTNTLIINGGGAAW